MLVHGMVGGAACFTRLMRCWLLHASATWCGRAPGVGYDVGDGLRWQFGRSFDLLCGLCRLALRYVVRPRAPAFALFVLFARCALLRSACARDAAGRRCWRR